MMTYTTDERFSAVRGDGINDRDDWMLQIRAAQKADEDEYECQVNTQHPIISIIVKLNVLCELSPSLDVCLFVFQFFILSAQSCGCFETSKIKRRVSAGST